MSNMEINQVLAQMRVMTAQMQNATQTEAMADKTVDFSQMLKNSIDSVNEVQQKTAEMRTAFETGEGNVDLAQVMIAAQKSSVSFQAMVQVRNKLVEAYKDVMNMPI